VQNMHFWTASVFFFKKMGVPELILGFSKFGHPSKFL